MKQTELLINNSIVSPLNEWDELFALTNTSPEPDLYDWHYTLSDSLDEIPWTPSTS